jgi:hypothetical protein
MSQQANHRNHQKMGKAVNQGSGPEGFILFFTAFRSAFPDLKIGVAKPADSIKQRPAISAPASTHQI